MAGFSSLKGFELRARTADLFQRPLDRFALAAAQIKKHSLEVWVQSARTE